MIFVPEYLLPKSKLAEDDEEGKWVEVGRRGGGTNKVCLIAIDEQ